MASVLLILLFGIDAFASCIGHIAPNESKFVPFLGKSKEEVIVEIGIPDRRFFNVDKKNECFAWIFQRCKGHTDYQGLNFDETNKAISFGHFKESWEKKSEVKCPMENRKGAKIFRFTERI